MPLQAFVCLDELCNIRSSEECVPHGSRKCRLLLFHTVAEGQGLNELLSIVDLVGRDIDGRSGVDG